MVNPAPVGRRQIGAVTESRCAACCAVDYCNSQCGVSSTTSTSSVMSSTPPFTSMSTLTESSTSFTHKITSASTLLTSPSSPLTSASVFPTVSAPSTTPFAVTSQIGTRFLVMVLPQYLSSLPNVPTLLFSSKSRGEVFIEGPGNNGGPHSLSYGENQINIVQEVITHKNIIETKGVLISSTVPVSVALIDYEKDVSDMSLVFPVDICSREYVVPSYTPLQRSSVVGIAALENNTTISITIRMTNGSLSYGSKTYTDGDILTLTLNRLQTFSLTHNFDLSGSSIMSSKPVCVTSGSAASVAGDYGSRLEEMIFPTEQFSKLFIVPTFQTRPGVIIRVMSHRKPVLLDATSHKNWHLLLSNNSFHDINITSQRNVVISSNESVLVVAYVKSADYDLIGPFMVLIPGVDQYLNTYQFSVPDFGFTSYVSIVVPTNHTSGLRLDNNFVSPIRDSIDTVVLGGKSYDIFSMYVSPGAHEMFHTGFTYFGLFVYGNQHADGYGYPAGVKFHIK